MDGVIDRWGDAIASRMIAQSRATVRGEEVEGGMDRFTDRWGSVVIQGMLKEAAKGDIMGEGVGRDDPTNTSSIPVWGSMREPMVMSTVVSRASRRVGTPIYDAAMRKVRDMRDAMEQDDPPIYAALVEEYRGRVGDVVEDVVGDADTMALKVVTA
jgi:hypothetical protein